MMKDGTMLEELCLRREAGEISYKGIRYLLIRPETLGSLYKALFERYGEGIEQAFFEGGLAGGGLSAGALKEREGLEGERILLRMAEMGTQIGWGRFVVREFDAKKKAFVVSVRNSPFAASLRPSSRPVCHMIRGVLEGVAAEIFQERLTCRETRCAASGHTECLFEAERPREGGQSGQLAE